ncbi:methylated-DNA--[protein]-cysteine S-methyltransferase [Mesorhizobium sp. YR577]|uniref:methylated-DNA--[protein]-cysteine S-methyltransferase n=1 Tax=Mesorhizobium sp. YR577 TaxID=1884373 RepID=UPI0008F00BE7|nr:methylated-DNA--[protein]-cysteine S-methyltransferase [Mesorhizobium sp. YR577]SFT46178.1 methylated-DNA-[protein]-cysteine S-methyltransferase [Mesorhizobium sp. YR577]
MSMMRAKAPARDEKTLVALIAETIDTPIGRLVLLADGDGSLCAAEFEDCGHRLDRWLRRRFGPDGYVLVPGHVPAATAKAFSDYFAGKLVALDEIAVALSGTDFQNAVWQALRRVEPGKRLAYSALAAHIGKPKAIRAVGAANGANPLSIVVPCHRLVGAGGDLVRYGGGLERKRWLLDHEANAGSA